MTDRDKKQPRKPRTPTDETERDYEFPVTRTKAKFLEDLERVAEPDEPDKDEIDD